jgi:hypothetical protein
MLTIFLLAIGGAIVASVVGTIWYSNKTPMGKLHMKYLGFDKLSPEEQQKLIAEAKPKMWKSYLGQMILSFLSAFAVSLIVIMSMRNGVSLSLVLGFVALNWLCFIVPTTGSALIWGTCDRSLAWKKFISDIASNLVTLIVIALLVSLFV